MMVISEVKGLARGQSMKILTNDEDPLKGFNQDIISFMLQKHLSGQYVENGLKGGKRMACVCGSLGKRKKVARQVGAFQDTREKGEMGNSQEAEAIGFCDSVQVETEIKVKYVGMMSLIDVNLNQIEWTRSLLVSPRILGTASIQAVQCKNTILSWNTWFFLLVALSIPGWGTEIPHAMWHSQKKKKKICKNR